MKKLLAAFLAISMMCALSACGGNSGSSKSEAAPGAAETGASDAANDKVIKLTIAHGTAETHPVHRALEEFAEELEASNHFEVQIYPNQQFGSDEEMLQSVKTGDLTMCVPPISYMANDLDSMALIETPYAFPNATTARATLEGDWGQDELEQLQDAGLYGLGYMESGMRELTNDKRAVTSPADLAGLKLRTMNVEVHTAFWNSLGCSAEGSAFSELYTNLSTGVYDGQENPIAQIYSSKFYEVQKYITMTDHVYTTYMPVMTTSFWASLSDEDQQLIQTAFEHCYQSELTMLEEDQEAQLQEMVDHGCEVTYLTQEQKQAFIDAAQPTLEKYAESVGEDVYAAFTTAVEANTVEE